MNRQSDMTARKPLPAHFVFLLVFLGLGGCGGPVPTRPNRGESALASVFDRNLIVNGDAERKLEGWSKNGNLGFSAWGGTAGEWDFGVNVLPNQGANYFRFTIPADQETTKVGQTVDVSSAAEAIDGGAVRFRLSGYFGGLRDEPGTTLLAARFADDSGKTLGEAATEPVRARDLPEEKVGQASVAPREKSGTVPGGTRKIVVEFIGKNLKFAESQSETIGFGDNLSLVLRPN